MNIQVGQWYQCRNKNLIAQVVGTILQGEYTFAIVLYKLGEYYDVFACTPDGRYMADDETHGFNLVKHLPGCDGPNWRQKRWREAKPEDAVKGVQCRAAKEDGKLAGFQKLDDKTYFYVKTHDGRYSWSHSFDVEVLE